jgi:hypothetical protein
MKCVISFVVILVSCRAEPIVLSSDENRPVGDRFTEVPTWEPPNGEGAALAGPLRAVLRRAIEDEVMLLAETADHTGKSPNIAKAILDRVDDSAFQDLLANEIVGRTDHRTFGGAVLVHHKYGNFRVPPGEAVVVADTVRFVWNFPVTPRAPQNLADTVRPYFAERWGARAGLVPSPEGFLLGAVASIEGVDGGRLLLVRAVDRTLVAAMATRVNTVSTVLMLSDGQKVLGTSVSEDNMPEVRLLVGKEESRVLVDKRHGRLAAAVSCSHGLWLWGVVTRSGDGATSRQNLGDR